MWAHKVGGTGAAVRLVAVEEDPYFTNIRAVTQTLGVAMDTVLSVEETVARFGLSWLPWASAPGALFVPAVPAYESTIDDARQPAAAGAGSRQEQVNETAVRAAVLASLGLTLAGGAVQVGEMCALATTLAGRTVADGERLRARIGSGREPNGSSQRRYTSW